MRKLIGLALLVIAGIVVYNYYFGSPEEKMESRKIFNQVKDISRSISDVVKSEKDKIEEGKYDKVFDQLGSLYQSLRKGANELDRNVMDKLDEFESRKEKLKDREKELIKETDTKKIEEQKRDIDQELERLMEETKSFLEKIKREQ